MLETADAVFDAPLAALEAITVLDEADVGKLFVVSEAEAGIVPASDLARLVAEANAESAACEAATAILVSLEAAVEAAAAELY